MDSGGQWGDVSAGLLARSNEVKKVKAENGDTRWEHSKDCDPAVVVCPFVESSLEIQLGWHSPFENAGAESRAPALMAMLSSGALQAVIDAIMGNKGTSYSSQGGIADTLKEFEGRSGITKTNSTQVFSGMPPLKLSGTALFRAWASTQTEVKQPIDKLISWALPVSLASNSTLLAEAVRAAKGEKSWIQALMPSISPIIVSIAVAGQVHCPMVIESVSMKLDKPIDQFGRFIEQELQITFCSLSAIDRGDWARINKTTP
mgnify:CR=1 FL=1